MKAFVTGGTTFVGRHVIRKLKERNHDVCALIDSKESARAVESLGATAVRGEITNIESMRKAMQGCQLVFHLEDWQDFKQDNWKEGEIFNVSGTRNVLGLAHELGVKKIIYKSALAVLGDTKGELVDEDYTYNGSFNTEYERTKWLAHYKVAVPLIEKGAPVVILLPGTAYGAGDQGFIGDLMQRFYLQHSPFPFLLAPSTTFSFTHVEDIAEGHLLAAEKGTAGESYILAGPPVPLGEMVDFWARLSGKRPPDFHVPTPLVRSLAPMINALGQLVDLPPVLSEDAMATVGVTYMANASKAHTKLGWQSRSLQQGMLEALGHIAAEAAERPLPVSRSRAWVTVALGAAVVAGVVWLLSKSRNNSANQN